MSNTQQFDARRAQPDQEAPRRTQPREEPAENRKPQQPRWMLYAVVAGFVLIMASLVGTLYMQNNRIAERKAQSAQYAAQLEELKLTGQKLRDRLDFTYTDEYAQQVARDKLEYVKVGEILFEPLP